MSYSMLFVGIAQLVIVVIRLFRPMLGMSSEMIDKLNARETGRKLVLAWNINQTAFGAILIAGSFLPDPLLVPIVVPLLIAVCISFGICNKIFLGTVLAIG